MLVTANGVAAQKQIIRPKGKQSPI